MKNLLQKWKCPRCESARIEEILINVTVASVLTHVFQDCLDFEYGDQSNHGGDIDRYQCVDCGQAIANTPEKLIGVMKGDLNEH